MPITDQDKINVARGVENQGAGNDDRVIKFDAAGDPSVVDSNTLTPQAITEDITVTIPFPLAATKYPATLEAERGGTINKARVFASGVGVTASVEHGTGVGNTVPVTGLAAVAAGTTGNGTNFNGTALQTFSAGDVVLIECNANGTAPEDLLVVTMNITWDT